MTSSLVIESESIETSFSSLYFLVFKESGVFKIGKANDVYTRSLALEKWLGPVSYDESFELYTTEKTVFKLEKALHFFMAEFAVEFTHGDGRTELFELESIGTALDYLKLYAKSSSVPIVVNEGIVVPEGRLVVPKKSFLKAKIQKRVTYENLDHQGFDHQDFVENNDNTAILLRSSVFSICNIRRNARDSFKNKKHYCFGEWSIVQSGEQLGQDDLDLLLVMIFMADKNDGVTVKFTRNSLISNLGWTRNSLTYKRLNESIERLLNTHIEIFGKKYFNGTLIKSCSMNQQKCVVELAFEVTSMIMPNDYCVKDLIFRLNLNSTQKWLHSYFMSFDADYPLIHVNTYHQLMGSNIKAIRAFRYELKETLDVLVKTGFLTSALIDPKSDLVHIK